MAKKQIHVHLHGGRAPTRDGDDKDGHWVTMHGAHVFIGKGGTIEKGPKGFMGKKPSDLTDEKSARQEGTVHHNTRANEHMQRGHEALGSEESPAPDKKEHAQNHYAAAHSHSVAAYQIGKGDKTGAYSKAANAASEKLNAPAKSDAMTVKYGGKTYEVKDVAEAQAKWNEFRDKSGAGVSQVGNGVEVMQGGKAVGRVSYNGNYHEAGSKYGPPALEAKPGIDRAKIAHGNAGKYSTLAMAKDVQAKQNYPAQVLMGEDGKYLVPANAKEGSLLVKGGYEVALDYNGKPPEKTAEPAKKERPPSKAALRGQAKGEYELAGRGHGSYAKAADLYEQAGEKEKAMGARALAKRYGHDKEGQKIKAQADTDAASTSRAQAKAAASTKERAALLELGDLYEKRSKDPENNELSKRISALHDISGTERANAQMGRSKADLDELRTEIRRERGDVSITELNAEMDKRLAATEHDLPRGYRASSEPSRFPDGGHRPRITDRQDGTTAYLSQHSFETPAHAARYAKAYGEAGSHLHGRGEPNPVDFAGYIPNDGKKK